MALRSTDRRDGGPTPSERPTVAAFDFDGTLTNAGSVFPFLVSVRGLIPVLRALLALSPGLVHAAIVGGTTADDVKERLFTRLLAGMPAEELNRRAACFAQRHLERHLREDMRRRLEWHRNQGHYTVIVSASPECYVSPAGSELGVGIGGCPLIEGHRRGLPGKGYGEWAPHSDPFFSGTTLSNWVRNARAGKFAYWDVAVANGRQGAAEIIIGQRKFLLPQRVLRSDGAVLRVSGKQPAARGANRPCWDARVEQPRKSRDRI